MAQEFRPVAVAGPVTSQFISLLDILKPSVDPKLWNQYGWDYYMSDDLLASGQSLPVDQAEYTHYEKNHIVEYATSASTVTQNTPGATLAVTLSATDHYDSGKLSYPQTQRIFTTRNRVPVMIIAKNTSTPGAHVITLEPCNPATAIGTISAGEVLVPITGAFGSGDTLFGDYANRVYKYTNQTMIRGDHMKLEGEAMASASWFQTNSGGTVFTLEIENDFAKVFRMQEDLALMLLEKTQTNYTTINKVIRTTEGLLPWIENHGGGIEMLDNEFVQANFDRINRRIVKRGGEKENKWYCGFILRQQMRAYITDVMKNGAITYGAFNQNKELAVNLGFESITVDGITHHLKNYALFNNEKVLGAPGFPFERYAVIMPSGSGSDPITGKKQPYMRLRYRAVPGYSREFEYGCIGGTGNKMGRQWQNFTDAVEIGYRSEKGFEGMCANKFQIAKPLVF